MSLFLGENAIKKLSVIVGQADAKPIQLQEKTITPTSQNQEVVADSDYQGLSKVIVNKVPVESLTATDNGNYTATNYYKTITVNIPYTTYRTGSGAPSNSLGSNGDLYFDMG